MWLLVFICVVAVSLCRAQAADLHIGAVFLGAAKKYVDDKPGLIKMYTRHLQAHAMGKQSELDAILTDMNELVIANEHRPSEADTKHIVTILADDQGWGDIGYNDESFVTPTLDFLAQFGVKFTSLYVQVGLLQMC